MDSPVNEDDVLLELVDVARRFESVDGAEAPEVLRGITLEVAAGEALAIVARERRASSSTVSDRRRPEIMPRSEASARGERLPWKSGRTCRSRARIAGNG